MRPAETILRLACDLQEGIETRLKLFSAEVELEKLRLARVVVLAVLAGGALFAFLLCLFGLALELTPDHQNHLVFLGGIAVFGLLVIACALTLRRLIAGEPKPFSGTRAELNADRKCLKSIARN